MLSSRILVFQLASFQHTNEQEGNKVIEKLPKSRMEHAGEVDTNYKAQCIM
jgi:hypothetical protein